LIIRHVGMDCSGVWGRDLGIEGERERERERKNRKDAGKIYEMDDGGELEDTGLHFLD